MDVRRVCVIGAGVSGLAAVKSCLEEGLDPVCYERDGDLGGLWNYDRDDTDGGERGGALYESLVTNSSKEMMCFSDFPFPEDAPPFLPARSVMKYYKDYADHFKLLPHIHFNTKVTRVVQTEDFDKTGRWRVTILQNDEESDHIFDAVMLATGFFGAPNQPTYPGEDEFHGSVIHANQYRSNDEYRGKNVVVVGGSVTAGDVAVDISVTAKQVYISMRNGTWVLPRIGLRALPYDLSLIRRINYLKPEWYWRYELLRNTPSLDEAALDTLGLRSERKFFQTLLMINDVIQIRILCGAIKAKPGIDHFTKRGLVFTDGTTVEADVVVYATGYNINVPFMDPSIVQETLKDLELYKSVFPPRLRHPTCACIGYLNAFGPHAPVFEMQARWAVRVFKGMCSLPSAKEMLGDVRLVKAIMYKTFGQHVMNHAPVPYADDLAAEVGALPTFRALIFRDPLMAYYTIFGPAAPYLYRLVGPHRWDGARDAYLGLWDKYRNATRTRKVEKPLTTWQPFQYVVMMMAILVAVFLVIL